MVSANLMKNGSPNDFNYWFGAGKMAQWIRPLAALLGDMGFIFSTHIIPVPEDLTPLLGSKDNACLVLRCDAGKTPYT